MDHATILDTKVWAEGHNIALRVYRITESFPPRERFGLAAQLRRAAVSIPTNLAEGSKRATDRDFGHFVNIAEASATEVEYLLFFCTELGLVDPEVSKELQEALESLFRKLWALRKRLNMRRAS